MWFRWTVFHEGNPICWMEGLFSTGNNLGRWTFMPDLPGPLVSALNRFGRTSGEARMIALKQTAWSGALDPLRF
jgi:hypothetical protein